MNKPQNATTVITGVGRGSYVSVFEPRLNELSGKEEFSMSFLIPKSDTKTISALNAAAKAAADARWPDPKKRPPLRNPLRDGDTDPTKAGDPAYAGHFWINVKTKNRPGVVNSDLQAVIDPRDFVSGDYCRISVNAYAYDQKGNRGVSFGLNNVQVVRKGEPLSGSSSRAEDEFSVFKDTTADTPETSTAGDDDLWN